MNFDPVALDLVMREELQRYVDRDAADFQTELADYDSRAIQAAEHVSLLQPCYQILTCNKVVTS